MKDLLIKEITQTLIHWGFQVGSTDDTDIFISETATAVGIGGALYELEVLIAIAIDLEDDAVLYYERLSEHIAQSRRAHDEEHHMLQETSHFDDKVHHKILRQVTHANGEVTETIFDLSTLADTLRTIVISHGLRFKVVLSLGKVHRRSHQPEPKDLKYVDHLDHPRHKPHHYVEPEALDTPAKTYVPYYFEDHDRDNARATKRHQNEGTQRPLTYLAVFFSLALLAAIFFLLL